MVSLLALSAQRYKKANTGLSKFSYDESSGFAIKSLFMSDFGKQEWLVDFILYCELGVRMHLIENYMLCARHVANVTFIEDEVLNISLSVYIKSSFDHNSYYIYLSMSVVW